MAIQYRPDREKFPEVHPPVGQMRRARRLVFVFLSERNHISGTSNEGFERENLCSRVGTMSVENPTAEGFDSHRLIKKGHIGKSVLLSLSEKNSINEAYRHSPPSKENSSTRRTDSE